LVSVWLTIAIAVTSAACATSHAGRGLVLATDAAHRQITISHDQIPGVMDAMVMPFAISRQKDLTGIVPGDRVSFRLRVGHTRTTIDRIQVLSAAREDEGLTSTPAVPALTPIGGVLPDVALRDQNDRPSSLSDWRGRVVAINFIYTRCPLPDYCPRLIATFDALRRRFTDRLNRDLVLATVTFDPRYDTPAVLKAYAAAHGADVPGWTFLTGSVADIARFCRAVGVQYWAEEGLITHSLQTAIVDRDGRLRAIVEGKEFTTKQLGDLVEHALAAAP
jgi:protein SCO1/2